MQIEIKPCSLVLRVQIEINQQGITLELLHS